MDGPILVLSVANFKEIKEMQMLVLELISKDQLAFCQSNKIVEFQL